MNKIFQPIIALVVFSFFADVTSQASVTITWQMANFTQSSGAVIPIGSLGVIVADTAQNGFSVQSTETSGSLLGVTLSLGNFIGPDDKIIDIFTASSSGAGGNGFLPGAKSYTYDAASPAGASFAATDPLAIYWFPTILTIGSTVTANTSFGFFTSNTVNAASAGVNPIAFIAPSDPSNKSLSYFTTDVVGAGGVPTSLFKATFTTVPEPSSIALLGGGLLAIGTMVNRRKSQI